MLSLQVALSECATSVSLLQTVSYGPIRVTAENSDPRSDPTQTLVASLLLCRCSKLSSASAPLVLGVRANLTTRSPSAPLFVSFAISFQVRLLGGAGSLLPLLLANLPLNKLPGSSS